MSVTPSTYVVGMEFWAQRTISPADAREGWTIVDNCYIEHERGGEYLRSVVDRGGSVGTARTYAGRLALWLGWACTSAVDECSPSVEHVAAFARWLERTPSRKHRPGRNRRQAGDAGVVTLRAARSPGTVDGIIAVVVEFVRFSASRGWCPPQLAERLSSRVELRFIPSTMDRGERTDQPIVQRRAVRRRRVERAPSMLSGAQVGALVDACVNVRDRFVVEALYATGLRVAELCGLRLADLHLLPSAAHLGCQVTGAHLHVVRREDNENGALAKSLWPRTLPVTTALVCCHNAYRLARDAVPAAAESDYLLVNLWRPPLGRALRPDSVERLFVSLSAKVGFYGRPHMLRHSFASEVALSSKDPALVKALLGHASVRSTDVYMHSRWDDMRAAVDAHQDAHGVVS